MKNINLLNSLAVALIMLAVGSQNLFGSSHREAPLISNDPLADNVDLYAFRCPDDPSMISIIATYVPLQLPHGGPNYYTFGENVRYEIHIDNDASIPGDEITYRFTFNITNEDPSTFFNIRLGAQNQKATYTLERSVDGGNSFQTLVSNGVVPPNNIGQRSIEGGAGLNTTYSSLFNNAITSAPTGERVFAGPTDDPFFVDLAGIFDLGDAPRQEGLPNDGVACYNVSTIALQIPISTLLKSGAPTTPTNILDSDYVIGVWASASRQAVQTLSSTSDPSYSGEWVQVSRLGMPLTNEAVIPIGQKDFWNRITPYDEIAETTLDEYFFNPELALYMDDDQFGGAVPSFAPLRIQTASLGAFDFTNGADGLYSLKGDPSLAGTALDDAVFGTLLLPAPGKPRSVDLWPAFHTGVPNVIPYQLATGKGGNPLAAGKPFVNNFLPNGGDMLRLNMAVPPTPRDDANFSSLGLIQAAAIGLTVAPFNETANLEFIPNMDGFPNGRRLEDDVTRIELQAVGGVVLAAIGLWYDDYDPANSPSPVTQDLLNVLTYTTGVENNDLAFLNSFPYVSQPHSGTGPCSGELYFKSDPPLENPDVKLFVSSNNSGTIGLYTQDDQGASNMSTFPSAATDADGIYYDSDSDVVYQLNRTSNVINAYSNVRASLSTDSTPNVSATSSSDFSNGRELTFLDGKLIVAQDAADSNGQENRFVIYNTGPNTITFDKSVSTDINLWGMTTNGNDLIAIVDNSSDVAIFNNFLSNTATTISPSSVVTVNGIVRTHGVDYDAANDVMVLTDVGSGAVADDGALIIVNDWSMVSADGVVTDQEQIRIAGPATNLGNPVDVAYDHEGQTIYVTERANDGGRFLSFALVTSGGNFPPISDDFYQGASAVFLANCRNEINPEGDEKSIAYYSLDACNSNTNSGTNTDFSEFTAVYPEPLSCATVSATNVQRTNPTVNSHSCTPGIGNSPAMCVSSLNSCDYVAGDERSITFDVVLNSNGGETASITKLDFYEKAPTTYDWINGPSGINNYPTMYGLRILLDGVEVFQSIDNPATIDWSLESFDLSGANINTTSSAVVTFELLGYCTIDNGALVNAWDLDEINVYGDCNSNNRLAFSGSVATEMGVSISEVDVILDSNQDGFPLTYTTDDTGSYIFNEMPSGFDYTIQAEKNNDYLNGVSTLDIILIQKHILNIENLDSEYKRLAADVNGSNSISSVDLLSIRKLILGLSTEMPNGLSWGFIDQNLNPADQNNLDNTIAIDNALENSENLNLVAVKYGDVNNDITSNLLGNQTEVRSDVHLDFALEDQLIIKGQNYVIPIYASNFNEVSGFQFTLECNGLNLTQVNEGSIGMNEAMHGNPANKLHTFSWSTIEAISVERDEVLFTLKITANENGRLSEMIQMTNAYTPKEAYVNGSLEKISTELILRNGDKLYANHLYQNQPNPFSNETLILFDLNKSGYAEIEIYDAAGRLVFKEIGFFEKGANSINVASESLGGHSGTLFYKLKTQDFQSIKKMIRL